MNNRMIKIVYNGKTVDDKYATYTRTLDDYDLIILRQALKCQGKREDVILDSNFVKVYEKKLLELYEIIDSNMGQTVRVESRRNE